MIKKCISVTACCKNFPFLWNDWTNIVKGEGELKVIEASIAQDKRQGGDFENRE